MTIMINANLFRLGCFIALVFLSMAKANAQSSILSDSFDYSGWNASPAPMSANWTSANGNTPTVAPNNTWIQLNTSLIHKNLDATLSTDFQISLDVLPTSYSTVQWFGLFDSTGSNGYGFKWDSSSMSNYGSQGSVCIQKYSGIASNNWSNQGTTLGSTYASGHNAGNTTSAALSAPFAHVVLSWVAASHTLTLFVDGKSISSVWDGSFSSFSSISISGNGGLFDNLSITTSAGASTPFGTNVLTDTMSYTGWNSGSAPMNSLWINAGGSTPAIIEEATPNPPATNSGTPNLSSAYISLNNGLVYATLSQGLTTSYNFSIAVDIEQTAFQRVQWVGLFDTNGTNGYALAWDSTQSWSYNSQGIAEIRKCTTGGLTYSAPGILDASAQSGHNNGNYSDAAVAPPFAHFVLSWAASTHMLSLSVDGNLACQYYDPNPLASSSLTRLYIAGNASGLFANLNVTTAAPIAVVTPPPVTPPPVTPPPVTPPPVTPPPVTPAGPGATVPFVTYEAEAATLGAGAYVTILNASNLYNIGTQDLPVTEASGRAYASLSAEGQSLTFNVTQTANSIVVRHNVPFWWPYNNKTGPGATLHLWVNSETTPRQVTQIVYTPSGEASQLLNALSLSSYHNESNTAYWEETRALISGPSLNPGDKLRLEVDSGDWGGPYNIDSIDLENVPTALTQPANTYSVKSYGAYGDGIHDDTSAIQNTINAAQANSAGVWIPPGIYNQSAQFNLNGVKVYGGGMWYTNLVCIYDPQTTSWQGYMGFSLTGNGDEVHDLAIDSAVHVSRTTGGKPFICGNPGPTNWVIENVWITHSIVATWMGNDSYGLISGCRVRFTYADGIHLDGNCNHDTITNCHVRGAGDDGIAILSTYSSNYAGPSHDNTATYNTVLANWSASNFDLAGGYNNVVENNYLADSGDNGSLVINMSGGYQMYDTTGATLTGNTIVRGGGDLAGQQRGAIWIWPNYGYPTNSPAISNLTFTGNTIQNSIWRGIQFAYPYNTQQTSVTFNNNTITGTISPTGDGIDIDNTFVGTGSFNNNTVSVPGSAYRNSAPGTFKGSGSLNVPAFSFP